MISLIFSCRVENSSRTNYTRSYSTFTPIPYPDAGVTEGETSVDVLVQTLKTYASLRFKSAIFRIEIVDADPTRLRLTEERVAKVIQDNIQATNLDLRFERPSTKAAWLAFVEASRPLIGDEPVLVTMNHDHICMGNSASLAEVCQEIFDNNEDEHPLLAYTHVPESLAWGLKGINEGRYVRHSPATLKKVKSSSWIDCLYIMRLNSFAYIFERMRAVPGYVPRFDWPKVEFAPMNLQIYVTPIEFFKHYDGYGHTTGIRTARLFSQAVWPKGCGDPMAAQAYREFVELHYIYLRDVLRDCRNPMRSPRPALIRAIEDCLELYFEGNVKRYQRPYIRPEELERLISAVRTMVYYDLNKLYSLLMEDVNLIVRPGLFGYLVDKTRTIVGRPSDKQR